MAAPDMQPVRHNANGLERAQLNSVYIIVIKKYQVINRQFDGSYICVQPETG